MVTFTAAGTCVIDGNQAGNANYNAAAQVQQSITVNKAAQTVSFTSTAPAATVGGATYTPTATASSGLTPAITVDGTSSTICTITGGVVSFIAAGTCTLDANQAGNGSYSAATQVQQAVTVGKGNQTVTFTSTAPGSAAVGGASYTPTATSSAGLTVAITLDATSTGCSLTSGVVTFTAPGTCVLDANQAGNANYNAATQVKQTFAVAKGSQTITFTSTAPTASVGGATYTPVATGGASGNPVTFTIDATASSVCSITAGAVSFQTVGTCVVDANQAGNANYNAAAQVQQTFAVAKGAQTVSFTSTAPGTATVGGATYTPTATASSGLTPAITVDASASAVCSITAGVVHFTAAGSCVLDANQAGNANYNAAAQVQQTFAVGKGNQTVSFTSTAPGTGTIGAHLHPDRHRHLRPDPGHHPGRRLHRLHPGRRRGHLHRRGTCLIDANQAGNANYNAAPQVQQSISVGKTAQTVTITSTAPGSATVGGATYTPTATATSGLAVTLTIDSSTAADCTITGGVVSFTGAGNCTIDANQAGNATYAAATQVQQTFVVGKGSQTITFTSTAPTPAVGGPTYTPTATGGASGNPVTFTIDGASTAGACSIAGGVVSFTGAGSCIIDANQAGNANYNAAPQVQQTVTVTKANQTITYTSTAPGSAVVGGATYTADRHRRGLGQPGDLHHRRHRLLGVLDHGRGGQLPDRRQLRHRRQPGRQRQLQRRHPGPADLRGRQGRPDGELHLDRPGLGHRRRGHLHPDRHRHLGPDPGHHHRRVVDGRRLCDHRRRRLLHRGRDLHRRRQPGRQRQLQRRRPGAAVDHRVQGHPDHQLHLDGPRFGHRRRRHLRADGLGHLGPARHPDRRLLDGRRLHHQRRPGLLHRRRQLHPRRQPGRQRLLRGGHPGPADLRGGQGLPDRHHHLAATVALGRRPDLHGDRHRRGLGQPGDLHHRRRLHRRRLLHRRCRGLLHRGRQLHHRRQPGRQRQLQRRPQVSRRSRSPRPTRPSPTPPPPPGARWWAGPPTPRPPPAGPRATR